MRFQLDDNERGAFNYLFGGVAVVLLLRGLAWLADVLGPELSADGRVLRPFQQGYMGMRDQLAVADASSSLSERVMLAVVLAVGISFLLALLFATVARARGRHAGRAGRLVTRSSLVIVLAWSLYAAFFVPVKEARIIDGTLVVQERSRLMADIPLPFTKKELRWQRRDVAQIAAREIPPVEGCDGTVLLEVIGSSDGTKERIAGSEGICAEERMDHLRSASEAAALLERELR